MHWGLIPSWFKGASPKQMQYSTNNCRSENILAKKSYKVHTHTMKQNPFKQLRLTSCFVVSLKDPMVKGQRCVILADGFYEWQKQDKVKQPFFIYFPQTEGSSQDNADEPAAALSYQKTSGAARPGRKTSSDLTGVCLAFPVALRASLTPAFISSSDQEKAAAAEIATSVNKPRGAGAAAKMCTRWSFDIQNCIPHAKLAEKSGLPCPFFVCNICLIIS